MIPSCLRASQDILRLYALKHMPLRQFLHSNESGSLGLTDSSVLSETSAICRLETDQAPIAAEHVSRNIQRSPALGAYLQYYGQQLFCQTGWRRLYSTASL